MQLGPVHVVRRSTWQYFSEAVTANCSPFTVHPTPSTTRTLPIYFSAPDSTELSREAAARVVAAYHKAIAEDVSPGLSLWQCIDTVYSDISTPLKEKRVDEVHALLSRMLQLSFTCGVSKRYPGELEALHHDSSGKTSYQLRLTDSIVNLAEAVGASRRPCIEQQGYDAYLHSLNTDVTSLIDEIERLIGFDVSHPQVAGALGYHIGDKLITCDSMHHSHAASRLRGLGATADSRIIEIGGGYGCLAMVMARSGCLNYEIYDLPWVNALQGYMLILSLGPENVRLFGETVGDVKVMPFWHFHNLAENSVDYVVNTDSLPEIGNKTAREYIERIGRILRHSFLSINQEAQATPDLSPFGVATTFDPQNRVLDLVKSAGGMRPVSRSPWWMREGYVEEVYTPIGARSANAA
jgi:hypothetical protein